MPKRTATKGRQDEGLKVVVQKWNDERAGKTKKKKKETTEKKRGGIGVRLKI